MFFRCSCAAVLAILVSVIPAEAYYQDYLPSGLMKVNMLPQNTIASDFGGKWECEILPGVFAHNCEDGFSVTGADKHGKSWLVEETEARSFGGYCYTADVDCNGTRDVIFFFYTGSCGLPFYSVVILFVDQNGAPHREEAISRFTPTKSGLQDLVVAPDGKGSLLLVQDLAYGKLGNRDLGYWRWSMMRAHDCKLEDTDTAFGMHFPCFVWYTFKPNHLLSKQCAVLERTYQAHLKDN